MDYSVKSKIIKQLEEHIGKTFATSQPWIKQIFLTYDTKSTILKRKNWQTVYIKIKTFCSLKDTVNRMKKQSRDWKKIFSNYISKIFSIIYSEHRICVQMIY